MTENTTALGAEGSAGLYANFPSRLNALTIDSLVLIGITICIFTTASFLERQPTMRVGLAISWWLILFLYEPICVSRFGGTVGHRLMNLQVVDNRTRGPVSPSKAFARYLVKVSFGVFSFLTMSFTRRHQAIHDLMTNSSVRIRNVSKARPHQYTVGPA